MRVCTLTEREAHTQQCACILTSTQTHIRTYKHTYKGRTKWTCQLTYMSIHTCIYRFIHVTHAHIQTYTFPSAHLHVHVHTRRYIHKCTHACMHMSVNIPTWAKDTSAKLCQYMLNGRRVRSDMTGKMLPFIIVLIVTHAMNPRPRMQKKALYSPRWAALDIAPMDMTHCDETDCFRAMVWCWQSRSTQDKSPGCCGMGCRSSVCLAPPAISRVQI